MVGLVAALEVEGSALARSLPASGVSSPHIGVREGVLESKQVVLAIGGVGKVAAAIATQFLCDSFHPNQLICFGLAGAIIHPGRGEVIVASGALYHDLDARPLTTRRGEIPGLGRSVFEADPEFAQALFGAAISSVEHPEAVHRGLVLTGDQIVTSSDVRDRLAMEFPGAVCIDMETAAVAQVANQNGVPWAAVRLTSDSADETFDLDDVLEFGSNTAGELFERIIRAVMKGL